MKNSEFGIQHRMCSFFLRYYDFIFKLAINVDNVIFAIKFVNPLKYTKTTRPK